MQASAEVSLADKVEFLRQPERYPDEPAAIDVIETHFAWVFLSRVFAYKMKKPQKFRDLNLISAQARRRSCELEVSLNRRLAEATYIGVVRLSQLHSTMQLEGDGLALEWLVKMRRLPAQRNLIHAARDNRASSSDLRALVTKLMTFYKQTPAAPWGAAAYLTTLRRQICDYGRQLSAPEFHIAAPAIDKLVTAQCHFIERRSDLLEARIDQGRVVDAHGDLRPEHIFLLEDPQIIDCLEFKPELRLLDTAAEIVFLALECERLQQRALGEKILELYLDIGNDPARPLLLSFYRSMAALARALVSAWHLLDTDPESAEPWIRQANWYIDAAQASIDDASP